MIYEEDQGSPEALKYFYKYVELNKNRFYTFSFKLV